MQCAEDVGRSPGLGRIYSPATSLSHQIIFQPRIISRPRPGPGCGQLLGGGRIIPRTSESMLGNIYALRHGHSWRGPQTGYARKTPTYQSWKMMRYRCRHHPDYADPVHAFVDGFHTGLIVTILLLAGGVVVSYLTLRPRAAVPVEPTAVSPAP